MARLHREAMRVLIAEIVVGERPAGALLPPVPQLAAQLGVSRGVAGECARALEERGLVTVQQGRGTTVNAHARWDRFDPDVFAALLRGPTAAALLEDHLECRRTVEIAAAGIAAARAGAACTAPLAAALAAMEEAARRPPSTVAEVRYQEADAAFHAALVAAAGNRPLATFARRIERALLGARPLLPPVADRAATELAEHRRIVAAVAAGDPVAARAATIGHLRTAERQLVRCERADDMRSAA